MRLRLGLDLIGFRPGHTPTGLLLLLIGRRRVYILNGLADIFSGFVHLPRRLVYVLIIIIHHAYKENSVIKISTDDNYHKKVIAILEALKNEADIIVFPEFSIPFDYLEEMQKFADENGILVVAGSHYVVDENLEKYGKLFTREFEEAGLLKNISPVVIPSSKIVHNEKYLGARIERSVFSEEGMEPGKVNHIFRQPIQHGDPCGQPSGGSGP